MGAIHLGHISLIKKSIKQSDKTIVTIFINKPQFNRKNDFIKYPRMLNKDISILTKLKVDFFTLPTKKANLSKSDPTIILKLVLLEKNYVGNIGQDILKLLLM